MNEHNQEKHLDSLLTEHIEEARPRSEWKVDLIERIEKQTAAHKEKRAWWVKAFVVSVPFAVLAAVVLYVPTRTMNMYSMTPWYVPTEWDYDHIHYAVADGFELPRQFEVIEPQYYEFTPESYAPLVQRLNPAFAAATIQQDEHHITFSVEEGVFVTISKSYVKEDDASTAVQQFQWSLFATDQGSAFKQEVGISKQEQAALVAGWLDEYPELTFGYEYILQQLTNDTVEVELVIDDHTVFHMYDFRFYDGRLNGVTGYPIVGFSRRMTDVYGTADEIVADKEAYPYYPVALNDIDVDIRYEITDYRISENGLEVYLYVSNVKEIAAAAKAHCGSAPGAVKNFTGTWTTVAPKAERRELIEQVHNYQNKKKKE